MGNSLGKLFVVTSFGESHGKCIGVVVDGCPAGLPLEVAEVQRELDRRRPAFGVGSTSRVENDKVEILSGIFKEKTTGAPICLLVWNRDVDSSDYERTWLTPRPGHADFTAYSKYRGFNDYRGGGRFTGRITAGFVMAGAVARKLLSTMGIDVLAHTIEIAGIQARPVNIQEIRKNTEDNALKCADLEAVPLMTDAIETARREGDSVGGVVECVALDVPVGVGEPVFDTLEGDLARAFFAIPAVKAIEFGSGFSGARRKGSENNDPFQVSNGRIVTLTNNAGGILGGMSTGMPIVVRVAVKPTPSIAREQQTVDMATLTDTTISAKGRHDTCIVPRAVPVIESMMAITLADFTLRAGVVPRIIR